MLLSVMPDNILLAVMSYMTKISYSVCNKYRNNKFSICKRKINLL